MKELHVDWDEIDGEYREVPTFGASLSTGSSNMKETVVLPDAPEKKSSQFLETCSPSSLMKTDLEESLQTKIKPDFSK